MDNSSGRPFDMYRDYFGLVKVIQDIQSENELQQVKSILG